MSRGGQRLNPYVGLRPFDRADSLYFFGRRMQVAELLQQLHEARFLAVVGSSGCGKSSLILAGLIPSLLGGFLVQDRDRWLVTGTKPGGGPIRNLARALCSMEGREPKAKEVRELEAAIVEYHAQAVLDYLEPWLGTNTNLLLLVDQFEEIFTFRGRAQEEPRVKITRDERLELVRRQQEAADFVDLALELAKQTRLPVYVVLAMRSDFLGDCDLFYGLPEAMNRSRYLVPRLNRGQLREAIEGPPMLMGQQLAPRLVDALLNELGDRSDRLPILQHALMRTWDLWQNRGGTGPFDREHYEAVGTLREALPRHAGEALREADLAATAAIFRRLGDTDPSHRRVRCAAPVSELVAVARVERGVVETILKRFNEDGRNFLRISPGIDPEDPEVEISHESLIRQWDQLAHWVDEEREARDQLHELVERARGGKALLQDPDLQVALAWRDSLRPTEAWARRYSRDPGDLEVALDYLERSRLAKLEAENRRRRNLRLLAAATVVVGLALSALTLWALENAARARDTARVAMASEWMEEDPTRAALLLLEVRSSGRTRFAAPTMRELLAHRIAENVLHHGSPVASVAFSPDGSRIVTGGDDGTVHVWSTDGSEESVLLRGHEDLVRTAVFSADGSRVVTASADATARVWSSDGTGEPLVLRGHGGSVETAAFSPDGIRIVTASEDGTARVWDADGSGEPRVLHGHEGSVETAAFSPDGTRIVTGSRDGTTRVWSTDGSGEPVVLAGHGGSVVSATFSPDGTRIATASSDGTVRVWSADGSGEPVVLGKRAVSMFRAVETATFSPDGTRILTSSNDAVVRLWNADGSGEPIAFRLAVGTSEAGAEDAFLAAGATAFSPDGRRIVTADLDGTVRLWEADGSGDPILLRGHEGLVGAAVFDPDGRRIVTASYDGTARVWSTAPPVDPVVLSGHDDWVVAAAFSADGSRIATASSDGTVRVWSADGSGEPIVLSGHEAPLTTVSFSPDGTRIVTASDDGTARVWRADGTGETVVLRGHESRVATAAFSADGSRIVTAAADGTARVWRADGTGEPVILRGHEGWVASAIFSADGTRIVTASGDETARIWNADGTGEPAVLHHEDRVATAVFSPDDTRIVTGSHDRTAGVWRADGTGEPIVLQHEGWVEAAAFSADGSRIVTASDDGTARVWNADGLGEPVVLHHGARVVTAAFSADGTRIVTGSGDHMARVWAADGGGEPIVLSGHEGRLTAVAFSPDGARVLTASIDGTARVWACAAEGLEQAISSATHACLDARFRENYLEESPGEARRRFEQCGRGRRRTR